LVEKGEQEAPRKYFLMGGGGWATLGGRTGPANQKNLVRKSPGQNLTIGFEAPSRDSPTRGQEPQ